MTSLDWLTARPIAHRGLHDAARGVIENTRSAFQAALAGNYGIECDVQLTGDGEAIVHHDDALGRLTEGAGRLADLATTALKAVAFKRTADRMITLGELCDLIAGRVTLVVEIKSHFDGDARLARRTADVLTRYAGPVTVMSFDPAVIEVIRQVAPGLTRGIVAERHYVDEEWKGLSANQRRSLAFLLHAHRTRPQFLAYHVKDLSAAAPWVARHVFGLPLLTWTVRGEDDRRRAARWADQVIFEGWRP
jgi:glycerophosphoryl diester phosphodiesterase